MTNKTPCLLSKYELNGVIDHIKVFEAGNNLCNHCSKRKLKQIELDD